jgi:hypothetical protein
MCVVCRRALVALRSGLHDAALLPLTLTVAAQLFPRAEFRASIASLDPSLLLSSFALSPSGVPLFEVRAPIAQHALTFFYVVVSSSSSFVDFAASSGYSNAFVYHLVYAAELGYESVGFSELHKLLVAAILRLVRARNVAARLNENWTGPFNCRFQPLRNSYADLLLDVFLNMAEREAFSPALVFVFHAIAPELRTLSRATAANLMAAFERLILSQSQFAPLFVEGLAAIVHKKQSKENMVLAALYEKSRVFRHLQGSEKQFGKPLGVVLAFIKAARDKAKAAERAIPSDELAAMFADLDLEEICPPVKAFQVRECEAGYELERYWDGWVDMLVRKACQKELRGLELLHRKGPKETE